MSAATLPRDLCKTLADSTVHARVAAERACRAALENLAVHEADYRPHMSLEQRQLRNRLRARGRALGDALDPHSGKQDITRLYEHAAYEHWHRLLFTRFLAENHLLHTDPENGLVPVTLDECEELAPDLAAKDGFDLACRFASRILPGVFRSNDPVLDLALAPSDQARLRELLAQLPPAVFTAQDALGWTYQFWQTQRKEEVNASGSKIGAAELSPVTQLFTEDYMVDFLLDNTLGAWWAGKKLRELGQEARFATETEARAVCALPGVAWKYLRFIERSTGVPPVNPTPHGRDARAPFSEPPFLDIYRELDIHERNLPHWQQDDCWIFLTWRLADSLPAEKLAQWRQEKEAWMRLHPEPWDEPTQRDYHNRFSSQVDTWLDSGAGACVLALPAIRKILVDALLHFDGSRYSLGDFVVMPNHVHVLVRPLAGHLLADILHSWKSFTSKAIHAALGTSGRLWQEEYWDRLIRNEKHLDACKRYIAENPIKAALPKDAFSHRSTGVPPVAPHEHGRDARAPFFPAAGIFEEWPRLAKDLTCLDPCMGSGHFIVALFHRLVALRIAEEHLEPAAAVLAVLRDNLHGLELDPRCTQIAAFNLALAAWKLAGFQALPPLHLACSGLAPHASERDWIALAKDNDRLKRGMQRLHALFQDAPVLGSLIQPDAQAGDLVDAPFGELAPLFAEALASLEASKPENDALEAAVTAQGLAKAAELLSARFTLVLTNVPYLGAGKQVDALKQFCERHHKDAKADLATAFLERCLAFCQPGSGSTALVTPQNWLFLGSYKKLRQRLLQEVCWNSVARLGPRAFETIGGEVVNVALLTLTRRTPGAGHALTGLDVAAANTPELKAAALAMDAVTQVSQEGQLGNPDAAGSSWVKRIRKLTMLKECSGIFLGVGNTET
jgi:REP element-mobilizing transposase RayT